MSGFFSFSNQNVWNKCFSENVVLFGISSPSLLQVTYFYKTITSAMRQYFMTYKRALLVINTRHTVTRCSCQNNPENIQERWDFPQRFSQRFFLSRFRHLCIIVTKQTPLFPLGNQEVTSGVIPIVPTGATHTLPSPSPEYCMYEGYRSFIWRLQNQKILKGSNCT